MLHRKAVRRAVDNEGARVVTDPEDADAVVLQGFGVPAVGAGEVATQRLSELEGGSSIMNDGS